MDTSSGKPRGRLRLEICKSYSLIPGAHGHEAGCSDKIGHVQGGMAIAQAGYSDEQEKRFKNYILWPSNV